jgi:RND family efflux transporter MFP subunit
MRHRPGLCVFALVIAATPIAAADFRVELTTIEDSKAVFATVESANVVPARARIGGTVATLAVDEGDEVSAGAVIATIGDEKLVLRRASLEARIEGARAELQQARTDLARTQSLFDRGTVAQARLDQARTAASVASNALRSLQAERSVIDQQLAEGEVVAPGAGRVLDVPVTAGTVVLPGETVAMIADEDYVLRLHLPERHARFLARGDTVHLGDSELGGAMARRGTITQVYPRIEDGRVIADAVVDGLGDFFVGERVRVWISAGERPAFIVPERFVATRFGVDYVQMKRAGGDAATVPVQRGASVRASGGDAAVEILSGVRAGDILVEE